MKIQLNLFLQSEIIHMTKPVLIENKCKHNWVIKHYNSGFENTSEVKCNICGIEGFKFPVTDKVLIKLQTVKTNV
jgi:hypothetical protein